MFASGVRTLSVALTGSEDLDRVDDLALGPEIRYVDRETGRRGADVDHVPGAARERDVYAVDEDRDQHAVVRRMRRAPIRVVVQDHVAGAVGVRVLAIDAFDVGGQGTAVHRRRVALAELPAVEVEDAGADVA